MLDVRVPTQSRKACQSHALLLLLLSFQESSSVQEQHGIPPRGGMETLRAPLSSSTIEG